MKNIHVLPTNKLSDLLLCIKSYMEHEDTPAENSDNKGNFRLGFGKYANKVFYKPHHIYITSDEEIKERDWFIREGSIHKCFRVHKTDIEFLTSIDSVYCGLNTFWSKEYCKKIILTTDQDLIKDGVQSIDDEFLEWFVKNPSCENIKIESTYKDFNPITHTHKIIIPKEEPKQTVEEYEQQGLEKYSYELKQETLEEGTWGLAKKKFEEKCGYKPNLANSQDLLVVSSIQEGILIGVKWQQERSYSEEEVKKIINDIVEKHCTYFEQKIKDDIKLDWFEQFKKK